jgi:hypothetical protein
MASLDEDTANEIAIAGAYVVPTLAVLNLMPREWGDWGLSESVLSRLASSPTSLCSTAIPYRIRSCSISPNASWS